MFGHFPLMLLSVNSALKSMLSGDSASVPLDITDFANEIDPYENMPVVKTKNGVVLGDNSVLWPKCKNKNENCTWWAEIGECEKNPGYLIEHCPLACNMCHTTLPKSERCGHDPHEPKWIESPGGLNRMFENILSDPNFKRRYNPVAHSKDPWVVEFSNFVSQQEADNIFDMLNGSFEGSTVVGTMKEDGSIERQTLRTRTSSNAWCNSEPCVRSVEHRSIQQRIAELTGASDYHMEDMQVLNYEVGQFYHPHHDTIGDQIQLMCGPRMLTAFIYFSDSDGGGETHFTQLGIRVRPKQGHMILWPSQKDSDSLQIDHRTTHEACNVTKGRKKAGNVWVHLYNYKKASHLGCAG